MCFRLLVAQASACAVLIFLCLDFAQAEACATSQIVSVRIREYSPNDFEALRRMHAAQGFGYPLPDLENPTFVSKLVLEVDDTDEASAESGALMGNSGGKENCRSSEIAGKSGREEVDRNSPLECSSRRILASAKSSRIAMAVLLRLTAETYLLHDPEAGTPRQRWQHFLALHDAAIHDAAARGLDDAQAFLPPRIARAFGRRLERLGWTRDPWPCFSRRVL